MEPAPFPLPSTTMRNDELQAAQAYLRIIREGLQLWQSLPDLPDFDRELCDTLQTAADRLGQRLENLERRHR